MEDDFAGTPVFYPDENYIVLNPYQSQEFWDFKVGININNLTLKTIENLTGVEFSFPPMLGDIYFLPYHWLEFIISGILGNLPILVYQVW